MNIRVLDATAIRAACAMAEAIDAVEDGFRALSAGSAHVPLRVSLPLDGGGTLLAMPATLVGRPASVKLVSVVPANRSRGLPLVQAVVLLLDPATGAPVALLDGTALTALRTGAAGGLAARRLAREDARVATLFGAGAQARTQLEALLAVRRIEEVRVVATHREHAEAFVRAEGRAGVRLVASDAHAVRDSDVVVCATTASAPVFDAELLPPGVHVTGVGSFTSEMWEIPPDALRDALVVVDQRDAALAEAGEVIEAVRLGYTTRERLVEIGEPSARRSSPSERTVFVSVGSAIQDLVVGALAFERATERGLGTVVEL